MKFLFCLNFDIFVKCKNSCYDIIDVVSRRGGLGDRELTDKIRKEIHFFGNIKHFLEEKLRFANDFAKPAFEKQ